MSFIEKFKSVLAFNTILSIFNNEAHRIPTFKPNGFGVYDGEKNKVKGFVTKFDYETVWFYDFERNENRSMALKPFFNEKSMFKGKNFWIEWEVRPGSGIWTCHESSRNRFIQLWNYYIRGRF